MIPAERAMLQTLAESVLADEFLFPPEARALARGVVKLLAETDDKTWLTAADLYAAVDHWAGAHRAYWNGGHVPIHETYRESKDLHAAEDALAALVGINLRVPPDADKRFQAPVSGLSEGDLAFALRLSIAAVQGHFPPKTGIIVFAFDFGPDGGMSYISNAERADAIKALEEWIAHQRTLS